MAMNSDSSHMLYPDFSPNLPASTKQKAGVDNVVKNFQRAPQLNQTDYFAVPRHEDIKG